MRTIVFDLDGTLADTAPDLVGAANALMRERGAPEMPYELARSTAGRGGKALISHGHQHAGLSLDDDGLDALFPRFLDHYAARIDQETVLFPGVVPALERLAAGGAALAVCTNKPEALALDLLARLDLMRFFGAVLGADTLPVRKPDPRHVLETIERVGGDPANSVLIGDSQTDRDAARNAEIPIILTTFGYAQGPVSALKPDAVISRYDELDGAIDKVLA